MATIRKRGDRWQVQIRRCGHGALSRSFLLLRDAEKWARATELCIDRSSLPADPRALERITLRQLVERYRDTVSVRKKRSLIERMELNAFLRHPICSKSLSTLQTSDFAEYRDSRLERIKPSSLKRSLTPIRHLFNVAKKEWGIPILTNPLDNLDLRASDQKRERRLRLGELDTLLLSARSCRNPLIAPIIGLALATGMRRGEILGMRREHINEQERFLIIPESKNGSTRTIPLTKEALSILATLPNEQGPIFPLAGNALRLSWQRLRRRAGSDDLRFHDLRHEAISRFFERGLTTSEVAMISGHKDVRMLFRYSHAMRATVLQKLDS